MLSTSTATACSQVSSFVHWREGPRRRMHCGWLCRCTGSNCREAVNAGRADYTSIFLSEIPALFRRGYKHLDVALLQVSPPDEHGFCSLGVSVDVSRAAAQCARQLVAVVNDQMPRTNGDSAIHISHFSKVMYDSKPLPTIPTRPMSKACQDIGRLIADNLIDDGATLQMGIGTIPDAVLSCLGGHRRLGVHTEMFSDGIIDLVEQGVVTNEAKTLNPGINVTSFLFGTQRLYDFVHSNPCVRGLCRANLLSGHLPCWSTPPPLPSPAGASSGCGVHQRHIHHRTGDEDDGHQQLCGDGPDRAGSV